MSDNITGKVVTLKVGTSLCGSFPPTLLKREGPILLHRSRVLTTRGALGVQDAERMRQVRPGL